MRFVINFVTSYFCIFPAFFEVNISSLPTGLDSLDVDTREIVETSDLGFIDNHKHHYISK